MIFKEYLDRLVEATPVQYYVSGIDGARVYWPWRMNKAQSKEFRQAFIEACDNHILDSNFKDESVENVDVLDEAADMGCDGAVLADVYHDPEATTDALIDGLELYDSHRFDGFLVLPLQDPYVEVYHSVQPSVGDIDVWWGIGGLKEEEAEEKMEKTSEFRAEVGRGPHVHGFGFGVTEPLVRAVRNDPDLLDSIDNSKAIQDVSGQGLKGKEQTSVVACEAQALRVRWLREMTPYAENARGVDLEGESQEDQSQLGEFDTAKEAQAGHGVSEDHD